MDVEDGLNGFDISFVSIFVLLGCYRDWVLTLRRVGVLVRSSLVLLLLETNVADAAAIVVAKQFQPPKILML